VILVAMVAVLALTGTENAGAARLASGLLIAVAPPAIAIGCCAACALAGIRRSRRSSASCAST
jgi:hypothetical protein